MSKVFIHPATRAQLDILSRDIPQSLLFTGPEGVGLTASIAYLADKIQATPIVILPEKDEKVDIEKGVITIDIIRRLYSMTKTIETKTRLIVIDYAERMGIQAQNAFLKLLEEPGVNTHFILLTHSPSRLLPTIRSRVQAVDIRPITTEQSVELLDILGVTDSTKRSQLSFIASGLPALLTALATDDTQFESRAQIVRDARQYLQGTMYQRLRLALQYKDDRVKALTLTTDAMRLLKQSVDDTQAYEVIRKLNVLLKVSERIEANGNVRLQLAAAML
ncbi:AAA family ATPase [Candidatus Saccharibacteria bacterium]|nr:AAA family ATPase [Candidatus Saccharibacteria bacterium]